MCIRDRDALEQYVPQLLTQVFHILVVYGLEYFLGLIGQTFFQALKGLLPVPGTALRRPQLCYYSHKDVYKRQISGSS